MPGITQHGCGGASVAARDCATLTHAVAWDRSGEDCQTFKITEIKGAKVPYEVRLNGQVAQTPYSLDTGVQGSVLVQISDADGCSISKLEENTLDLAKDLWAYEVGATARAPNVDGGTASHGSASSEPRTDVTATFLAPGGGLNNSSWAGWYSNRVLVRQTGSGIAKVTLGTEVNPIEFDRCAKSIEWGYKVQETAGLEGDDFIKAYLYWYGPNGFISDTQIGNHVDDFGLLTQTGSADIPDGATGVMMRFDIQSDASENMWIDPRAGDVYLRQA